MKKLAALVLLAACTPGKTEDPAAALVSSKWVEVSGDAKGMQFTVEVPEALPENKGYLLGRDWWVGAKKTGPRLTLTPGAKSFATIEEFEKFAEIEGRKDMTVIAAEKQPDGRLRFVRQTLFGGHLNVDVWVPKDAEHGMQCTGDWWYGVDGGGKNNTTPPPDAAHLAFLERFCKSLKVK
jgi:hypothetical protein